MRVVVTVVLAGALASCSSALHRIPADASITTTTQLPLRVWLPARDLTNPTRWFAPRVRPFGEYAEGAWDGAETLYEGYPPTTVRRLSAPGARDGVVYDCVAALEPYAGAPPDTMSWLVFERLDAPPPAQDVAIDELTGTWLLVFRGEVIDTVELAVDGTGGTEGFPMHWRLDRGSVRVRFVGGRDPRVTEEIEMRLAPDGNSFMERGPCGFRNGFVRPDLADRDDKRRQREALERLKDPR